MIVPRTLASGSFTADTVRPKAEPNHVALLFIIVAGAGIVAAVAAYTASGPFAGLRPATRPVSATSHIVRTVVPVAPIDASKLFPAPAPPATINQVVNAYDLPAPAPAPAHAPAVSKATGHDAAEAPSGSGHAPRTHPNPTQSPPEPPNGVPGSDN